MKTKWVRTKKLKKALKVKAAEPTNVVQLKAVEKAEKQAKKFNAGAGAILQFAGRANMNTKDVFRPYYDKLPPGVGPGGLKVLGPRTTGRKDNADMAMDSALGDPAFAGANYGNWAALNMGPLYNGSAGNLAFFGYPYLSELVQRAEYYIICETIAKDMTRKWGSVKAGDKKKPKNRKKDAEGNDDPFQQLVDSAAKPTDVDSSDPFTALLATDFAPSETDGGDGPVEDNSNDPFNELLKDDSEETTPPLEDDEDKTEKLSIIEAELKRLKVRELFYEAALKDGFFGRYQILPDFGTFDDNDEMATDLGDTGEGKIKPDSLQRLVGVEPLWTYPYNYSAVDPLSKWWYRPEHWFVMTRMVHTSRVLTFVGRPMPEILKPAYNFGGLSLVQLAAPYINKWIATAGSVADLVNSFVVGVLSTQMQDMLNQREDGANLFSRLAMFGATKNNQSIIAIDKDTEEYDTRTASIAGLEGLQAQALEHVSTVSQIPSVKWTGNEPAGLNASSEGTIRVYDDTIKARQQHLFGAHMDKVLGWIQLSKFGSIDPEIHFDWSPLEEESEKDKADLQKAKADTDQILTDIGAIGPEDVRERLSNDTDSAYEGVDPTDLPDMIEEEEQGLEPAEGRPTGLAGQAPGAVPPAGSEGSPQAPVAVHVHNSGGQSKGKDPFHQLTQDSAFDRVMLAFDGPMQWKEELHPRAPDGKFGAGGSGKLMKSGGGSSVAEATKKEYKKAIPGGTSPYNMTKNLPAHAKEAAAKKVAELLGMSSWSSKKAIGIAEKLDDNQKVLIGTELKAYLHNEFPDLKHLMVLKPKVQAGSFEKPVESKTKEVETQKTPEPETSEAEFLKDLEAVESPSSSGLSKQQAVSNEFGGKVVEGDKDDLFTKFEKGSSALFTDPTGTWVLTSPGHMTKYGNGPEALKALTSGTGWQELGVKNWTAPIPQVGKTKEAEKMKATLTEAQEQTQTAQDKLTKIASVRPQPTQSQTLAIKSYKGTGYGSINHALRFQKQHSPQAKEIVKWLDKASLPEDVELYRGIKSDIAQQIKSMAFVGFVFADNGFISTSTSNGFANGWQGGSNTGLHLTIKAKKGQKAASISTGSDHEYEVLVQRGSKFKVTALDYAHGKMEVELIQDEHMDTFHE